MYLNSSSSKPLTLLEINELNFDIVRKYLARLPGRFPYFELLMKTEYRETFSEFSYEKLEPWIQWVSAHSGMTADEHGVFRLGDAINTEFPQLLRTLEINGLSVGGISPMNMPNQTLNPAYFIPDPWTQTQTDGSVWSKNIWFAVSQAVNDNAQGIISFRTIGWLTLAFIRFASLRRLAQYAGLFGASRGSPWRKALFLDLLLDDLHHGLLRSKRPDFSILFLNAGAHIQHHYLFNAKVISDNKLVNPSWYLSQDQDPFFEMLEVYDVILGRHLAQGRDLIVATGLSQVPYDRVKFYYRLKNHKVFLQRLGVPFDQVLPRMTRDFLVECRDDRDAAEAARLLGGVRSVCDNEPVFGDIDLRGSSLFVSLTYPREIAEGFKIADASDRLLDFYDDVTFVAIKNGMHSGRGFCFFHGSVASHAMPQDSHVKSLYNVVLCHFGLVAERLQVPESSA